MKKNATIIEIDTTEQTEEKNESDSTEGSEMDLYFL